MVKLENDQIGIAIWRLAGWNGIQGAGGFDADADDYLTWPEAELGDRLLEATPVEARIWIIPVKVTRLRFRLSADCTRLFALVDWSSGPVKNNWVLRWDEDLWNWQFEAG